MCIRANSKKNFTFITLKVMKTKFVDKKRGSKVISEAVSTPCPLFYC